MKRFRKLFPLRGRPRKPKEPEKDVKSVGETLYHDIINPPLAYVQTPGSSLPVLPAEIWQDIVELACCVPAIASVSPPELYETGSNYLAVPKEQELAGWRGALTLQLVCRSWRVTAVKQVYRRVVLCCEKHMKPLVRTLEESKKFDPEKLGYGRWVREMETRRTACSKDPEDEDVADDEGHKLKIELHMFAINAVRIIRCVPNLQIYINKNGWAKPLGLNTYRAVMKELREHCGSSLLRLQWTASESPRWDDLKHLLSKTPNLRTLSLLYVDFAQTDGDGGSLGLPPKYSVLSHLEQLHLGPFPPPFGAEVLGSWDRILEFLMPPRSESAPNPAPSLPALHTVSITPLNLLSSRGPSARFFSMYGPQLENLATHDLSPEELAKRAVSAGDFAVSNNALPTLLEYCPNLRSLIMTPLQRIQLPRSRRLAHARLERVAIFPNSESYTSAPERIVFSLRQHLGKLFDEFTSGAFPRLKTLRLRDRGEFSCLVPADSREWIQEWQQKFEERGIRFENGDGVRFMLSLSVEYSMEDMPDDP